MKKEKISYSEALAKVEIIVDKIENDIQDVDELGTMIKDALLLIKGCKEKLKNTEDELNRAFDEIE